MCALAITRAVLLRILSSAGGVLGVLALGSVLPVFLVLAPTGLNSRDAIPMQLSYEVAFMGGAVAIVLGLAALERIAPLLAREPSGRRLAWESAALLASGLIGAVLPLLSGCACGAIPVGGAAEVLMIRILPALTTTVAAGSVIVRTCPTPGMAPWLFASGILLAPMILSQPVPPQSLVAMTLGFLFAAWLLDRAPIAAGVARTRRGAR